MENDLWEKGGGRWQRNFTEGADPEYEEQILRPGNLLSVT